jgi:hypothetical protein
MNASIADAIGVFFWLREYFICSIVFPQPSVCRPSAATGAIRTPRFHPAVTEVLLCVGAVRWISDQARKYLKLTHYRPF